MAVTAKKKEPDKSPRQLAVEMLKAMLEFNPLDLYDTSGQFKKIKDIPREVMLVLINPTRDPKTGRLLSAGIPHKLDIINSIDKLCPVAVDPQEDSASSGKTEEELTASAIAKVEGYLGRSKKAARKGNGKAAH